MTPQGLRFKATDACLPSHMQVSPWYGVYTLHSEE